MRTWRRGHVSLVLSEGDEGKGMVERLGMGAESELEVLAIGIGAEIYVCGPQHPVAFGAECYCYSGKSEGGWLGGCHAYLGHRLGFEYRVQTAIYLVLKTNPGRWRYR